MTSNALYVAVFVMMALLAAVGTWLLLDWRDALLFPLRCR